MQELYCSLLRGFFKYLAVSFFPSFLSWQFKSEEIHLSVVERKRRSIKMLKRNLQGFYSQLLSSLTFFQPVHLHPSLYHYITKNEAIFLKLSSLSSSSKKKMNETSYSSKQHPHVVWWDYFLGFSVTHLNPCPPSDTMSFSCFGSSLSSEPRFAKRFVCVMNDKWLI